MDKILARPRRLLRRVPEDSVAVREAMDLVFLNLPDLGLVEQLGIVGPQPVLATLLKEHLGSGGGRRRHTEIHH
jgi:hypothetical protein